MSVVPGAGCIFRWCRVPGAFPAVEEVDEEGQQHQVDGEEATRGRGPLGATQTAGKYRLTKTGKHSQTNLSTQRYVTGSSKHALNILAFVDGVHGSALVSPTWRTQARARRMRHSGG